MKRKVSSDSLDKLEENSSDKKSRPSKQSRKVSFCSVTPSSQSDDETRTNNNTTNNNAADCTADHSSLLADISSLNENGLVLLAFILGFHIGYESVAEYEDYIGLNPSEPMHPMKK